MELTAINTFRLKKNFNMMIQQILINQIVKIPVGLGGNPTGPRAGWTRRETSGAVDNRAQFNRGRHAAHNLDSIRQLW